jgi:(R,R)-butanediol dehydrogenase/meso-butanediol dehydrogenase/diacetyl reductase
MMPDREGPEFVFECVGRPGLLAAAISQVRPKGSVVSLGFCVAPEQVVAASANMREAKLVFPQLYTMDDYQTTLDTLDAGHIEPRLMVTGKTSLDDLPSVFESLRSPGGQCKVMVDPWKDAA